QEKPVLVQGLTGRRIDFVLTRLAQRHPIDLRVAAELDLVDPARRRLLCARRGREKEERRDRRGARGHGNPGRPPSARRSGRFGLWSNCCESVHALMISTCVCGLGKQSGGAVPSPPPPPS